MRPVLCSRSSSTVVPLANCLLQLMTRACRCRAHGRTERPRSYSLCHAVPLKYQPFEYPEKDDLGGGDEKGRQRELKVDSERRGVIHSKF